MRNFEERKKEIFRRSDNRIKERKRNRNRVLAVSISLCLIVTVWSVMVLPAMLPASKSDNNTGERMAICESVDDTDASYVIVEVMGTGTAKQSSIIKDDPDEVTQIYDTVQSSFVSTGGGDKESANESSEDNALTEEKMDYSQSATADMSSGYTIIFTNENDIQTIYSLIGDNLTNETTKQETVLTKDQRSDLLSMLGLTITWEEDLE